MYTPAPHTHVSIHINVTSSCALQYVTRGHLVQWTLAVYLSPIHETCSNINLRVTVMALRHTLYEDVPSP